MKQDIRQLSDEELRNMIIGMGEQKYRFTQLQEWLWQKSIHSFSEITTISKALQEKLSENFNFPTAKIKTTLTGKDKTIKIIFQTHDDQHIEGVLIPGVKRVTACISTQVGCPLNCSFCATGKMGFIRDLTAGEIVDQFTGMNQLSSEKYGNKLSNIVIMGMGEPLLNMENTLRAIEKISDPNGTNFSPARITLSTAGITANIHVLANLKVKFNLAISLHSVRDELRNKLMPINKSNPCKSLLEAARAFYMATGNRVTFEYLLLKDVNDSLADAEDLAAFCGSVPSKINILDYNHVEGTSFKSSPRKSMDTFLRSLENKNLIVNMRRSKGSEIGAACGQLAPKPKKV